MSDRTLTGERMSNATVLLIDNIDLIGDDLRWPLRLVAAQGGMLNIVVVGGREAGEAVTKVDLAASKQATTPATRVALTGRKALNDFVGEGAWRPKTAAVTAILGLAAACGDGSDPRRKPRVVRWLLAAS